MITLQQPWAWAVLAGIRPIITRSWSAPTEFTGPVLIHASRRRFDLAGSQWLTERGHEIPRGLQRGVIVGRAELACCVTDDVARFVLSQSDHVWLDSVPGAHHLVFNSPEFATQTVAAHDTRNGGIVPAPRGWKAAFESPADVG